MDEGSSRDDENVSVKIDESKPCARWIPGTNGNATMVSLSPLFDILLGDVRKCEDR